MSSETMQQIVDVIEAEIRSRPSAIEFEMAYQARIAIDRLISRSGTRNSSQNPAFICARLACKLLTLWSSRSRIGAFNSISMSD